MNQSARTSLTVFGAVAVTAAAAALLFGTQNADQAISTPAPTVTKPAVTTTVPGPTTTVTVTETPAATVDPAAVKEAAYLRTVRVKYPIAEGLPDSTLIELAKSACGALDRGASKADVIAMTVAQGGEHANVIAYAVGAGVAAYCPEHKALF